VPVNEQRVFSQAQRVQPGCAVGRGRVSHHFFVQTIGSPKVALLQLTPPVNVLGAVNLPLAP
jgi:hypothetical protein